MKVMRYEHKHAQGVSNTLAFRIGRFYLVLCREIGVYGLNPDTTSYSARVWWGS